MPPSSPAGTAGAPSGRVAYLTSTEAGRRQGRAGLVRRSAAASPGLPPVDLGTGAALDLGAVRLLARRTVLVDALLLAVLAVQRLPHLGLQVVVRSGLVVIVGSHPPTLAPGRRRVERYPGYGTRIPVRRVT